MHNTPVSPAEETTAIHGAMTSKVQVAPGPEQGDRASFSRRTLAGSHSRGSFLQRGSIKGALSKRNSDGSRSSIVNENGKRRKPRRQSGAAVAFEDKGKVAQLTRLERSDSDKVIRRNSMERKMSVRNSIRLPEDFLKGLKGLDDSLFGNDSGGGMDNSSGRNEMNDSQKSQHREFTEVEIVEMSNAALLSDSGSELSVGLDEDIDEVI